MATKSPFRTRLNFARCYVRDAAADRRQDACVPVQPAPHRPDPSGWDDDRTSVAWLGHATILSNFMGSWFLTDPALETRIGIGRGRAKFGPRRLIAPALTTGELPPLDLLLLSHAHMDHTDLGTLSRLPRDLPVVVQPGNRDLVRRFRHVTELAWGDHTEIAGIEVESVEVRHWGARMITDRHRGYGGYLLRRRGQTMLFAGDTAYTEAFAPIGLRSQVDLAALPIGAYDPWIANHASPEQAWRMAKALGTRHVLPIHHSTFRLSREPLDEPIARLRAAAGPEAHRIALTEVGQTFTLPT
ncbi:MAG TPA: MBL fold metallo-hydrolase [Gemmatimonadales bacterium]|jgi:L-ascorbate metabolism protein UlaG (beta-lactamase superfamily)|nr:MBL fold metallo-hydrolase [Gemmatimonadales bacterium]